MQQLVLITSRENRFKYKTFLNDLEKAYEIIEPLGIGQKAIHLVIGGDECLQQLKNLGSPEPDVDKRDIVYLPCGGQLDFARSLGMKESQPSLEVFNSIIKKRKLLDIPIMQCNGRRFINMARVGSLAELDEKGKKLKAALNKSDSCYRITFDSTNSGLSQRCFETLGFVVAQGLYGLGGLKLSTQVNPFENDSFEFLTIRSTKQREAVRTVLGFQKKIALKNPVEIVSIKTQALSILSNSLMPVNLDGEVFAGNAFRFSRDGGKLRFLLH